MASDGPALHQLIKRCPPLDENSRYCNLLQVSHFRDTAIVAEADDRLIGFVTGYRMPRRPQTLFVWQVGVAPEGRGQGLAQRLLEALLARLPDVDTLETTVTPDNQASMTTFNRLAGRLDTRIAQTVLFSKEQHFEGAHDDEVLLTIGPFSGTAARSRTNQPLDKTGT
jgi:L-2,4-diaminobutyric acid acetyltransferase